MEELSNSFQTPFKEANNLLVVFLVDVEPVGQAGQKSFHDDVVHRQSCFQAPEDEATNPSFIYSGVQLHFIYFKS